MLTQLTCDREAVFARQPQVEQHQCRRIDRHQRHQRPAVMHRRDAIALATQVVREELRDVDFIVEDGDMQGRVHSGRKSGTGRTPHSMRGERRVSALRGGPNRPKRVDRQHRPDGHSGLGFGLGPGHRLGPPSPIGAGTRLTMRVNSAR